MMGITEILIFVKTIFFRILGLCSLAWSPIHWFKVAWQFLLYFAQEITSALPLTQDTPTEKNTQIISLCQEQPYLDTEELRERLRRIQDISISTIKRLHKVEEQVGKFESDLNGEKELWKTRYLKLAKDHNILKEQDDIDNYTEETQHLESQVEPYIDVMHEDVKDGLNRHFDVLINAAMDDLPTVAEYNCTKVPSSLTRCLSVCSNISHSGCSSKSPKSSRVFIPRSPWELKIGDKVKILLPSGKIGIGYVYKMGQLPGKAEYHVGVDLEDPESWQPLWKIKGNHTLHGKKKRGVFVPFSKVLVAWE